MNTRLALLTLSLGLFGHAQALSYPIKIQDSLGTTHVIERPLKRVIVLNRQTAVALKLLQAEGVIIATGDTTNVHNAYLGLGKLPDMGEIDQINLEAVIALKPDAVLVHTNRANGVLEEKLNPLGIKIIRVDNYQPQRYEQELKLLATLFDREARARQFLAYRQSVERLVTNRVRNIPDAQKRLVLALTPGPLKDRGAYRVYPVRSTEGKEGVGEGYATVIAGGKDAMPAARWDPKKGDTTIETSEESVLTANPQVITLHATFLGGYNATDPAPFRELFGSILSRPSVRQLTAGKNKELYYFHTDFLRASMRHLGLLQLGKVLYPQQFKDINVQQHVKDYFVKWLGVPYKGIWFASAKD